MRKTFLFLVFLGVFTLNATAQTSAKEDIEHAQESSKGEKMKTLLGLTDEQTAKFRDVVTERRNALKTLNDDTTLSADAKETKKKAINDARETKLKAIFTPEQFAKWVEYKNSKKD